MQDKIKNIKIVCFDCDGVLTDGKITYIQTKRVNHFADDNHGTELDIYEQKNFSARDGMGIMFLNYAGLIPAVITGRRSAVLQQRCEDLKIKHLHQKISNKAKKMEEILEELGLTWDNVAYMGDDWNDYPMFKRASFTACPNDAEDTIKPHVDFISKYNGGQGAVREFVNLILMEKGLYEETVKKFDI